MRVPASSKVAGRPRRGAGVPPPRASRPWGTGTPSLDVIVATALEIIDVEGVDALTTRRLADELGMFQPNLYRRIKDRNHLLDLVVEAIMTEVGIPDVDPSEWAAWLTDCGLRIWRTWVGHPRAAVLLHHGGAYPATMRVVDAVLGVFVNGTIASEAAPAAIQAYLGYVFGTTMLEALGRSEAVRRVPAPLNPDQAALYPNLHALRAQPVGEPPENVAGSNGAEAMFTAGLSLVLDAIAAHEAIPTETTRPSR